MLTYRNLVLYDVENLVAPRVIGRLVLQPVNMLRFGREFVKMAFELGWLSKLGPYPFWSFFFLTRLILLLRQTFWLLVESLPEVEEFGLFSFLGAYSWGVRR